MVNILVTNNQSILSFNQDVLTVFKSIVRQILKNHAINSDVEVSLVLVDDQEIQKLNKNYRNKNVPTDVLSFPQYASLEAIKNTEGTLYLGDVIISTERVIEQAKEYNHSDTREFSYLFVHSLLHLLGYTHDNDETKKEMRALEEEILKKFDITR